MKICVTAILYTLSEEKMKILPILISDSYKQFHYKMYPKGMIKLSSNMTPRSFKRLGCDRAVWFGLQYYIQEYLVRQWRTNFFDRPLEEVLTEYKRFHKHFSFTEVDTEHIEKLHKLQYLPIEIKALPEGTLVPEKVPFFTITNTHPDFAWLVNFLETQMSTVIWDMTTVATIAHMYRKLLNKWAEKTGDPSFVQWQGHDFAMRGRSSMESTLNQAGHLLSFTGTDTIPAVLMLEEYYDANMENELIGSSVPASEHSIQTAYGKENEIDGFSRILDIFPEGIVSIVSDSFDLWKVCTEYVVTLKDKIMARNGKLVIRPDSGDPVDILCGKEWSSLGYNGYGDSVKPNDNEAKGVVELLWDVFGGTVNEKGYKVLDSHIGVIYGDSITLDRAERICARLEAKGFASTNVVFGIGSYTYNYNTRDTLGIAVKSTYCEVMENGFLEKREIFKDPITDDGTKKSARGLLCVKRDEKGKLYLKDRCTEEEERDESLLTTVFCNGNYIVESFAAIKQRLENEKA
jgi:nicotinamide phosphoribosyltransferase